MCLPAMIFMYRFFRYNVSIEATHATNVFKTVLMWFPELLPKKKTLDFVKVLCHQLQQLAFQMKAKGTDKIPSSISFKSEAMVFSSPIRHVDSPSCSIPIIQRSVSPKVSTKTNSGSKTTRSKQIRCKHRVGGVPCKKLTIGRCNQCQAAICNPATGRSCAHDHIKVCSGNKVQRNILSS